MPAYEKFIAGFVDYQKRATAQDPDLFARLAVGQTPKCMVIACCDSRVDPAILANAAPGELFILRNVANLVPPCEPDGHYHGTSAALEFAVNSLRVEYIVVMGHAGCGGVRALMTNDPEIADIHPFIHGWMRLAEPARARTLVAMAGQPLDEQMGYCERAVIKVSLDNLLSFPCIAHGVRLGRLRLRGLYFDIASGTLFQYQETSGTFEPLV
ncbi:MAG: carbonic anhydrase [Rhodospirillaceae bacterium]